MKISTLITTCVLALGSTLTAQENAAQVQEHSVTPDWQADFVKAQELAKSKSQPIFLYFSGSDWCPWCIRMDREILDTADFQKALGDKMVFYHADFPRNKKLDEAMKKANEELQKTYKSVIKGFPTVVIITADGAILGTLNYKPGGPEVFVKEVQKVLDASVQKQ